MQAVNFNSCVAGIDISHYQNSIDWQAVRDGHQVGFVSIKATEGATYVDPALAANVTGAKSIGLPVQLYHFAQPGQSSATEEAANFIKALKGFGFDLLPVLDLEEPYNPTMDKASLIQWVHDFIGAVKQAVGQEVVIYTGKWFADYYNDFDGQFVSYPLWIASYVENYDQVPDDFGGWTQWVGWQHSNKGQVVGIQGFVDLDIVNDLEAIKVKVEPVEQPKPQLLVAQDATNYIINRWLSHEFDLASPDDQKVREWLADHLRIASGQEPHNTATLGDFRPTF